MTSPNHFTNKQMFFLRGWLWLGQQLSELCRQNGLHDVLVLIVKTNERHTSQMISTQHPTGFL